MGKISPLNQITGLGYDWLKEQVGETLAINYFELYERKKQKEKYGPYIVYMYLFLLPLFLTEGLILQVFVSHGDNPLLFWQDIRQWAQFLLAVSMITLLGLFYLYDKDEGFYILSKLHLHEIVREYDGWFVLLFFLVVSGAFFYSSFLADGTMGKLFFLLGVLVLGLCFAFFRFIEWAYLRYSRLYDRLLWLNSQVENESFRKALEGLYGTKKEFKYTHELYRELKPWQTVESAVQSWKNDEEDWYQKIWVTFTFNYFVFWGLFAISQGVPEDKRIQRLILFVLVYFLLWIAEWVIRGKSGGIISLFFVLFGAGVSEVEKYYGLPIVQYFAILFSFIAVYLILRSRLTAQLIEAYKKKKEAHE